MADWVSIADGSPFEGDVPTDKVTVTYGEEEQGSRIVLLVRTVRPDDPEWADALQAHMFRVEGCAPRELWESSLEEGGPGSGHWGHAGVPGKHGGSAPSGGVSGARSAMASAPGAGMSTTTGPTARARWEKARQGARDWGPVGTGGHPTESTATDRQAAAILNGTDKANPEGNVKMDQHDGFIMAGWEDRREVKDEICLALSERTGLTYGQVNSLVKTWANSSANTTTMSLELQVAAGKEFGLEVRSNLYERLNKAYSSGKFGGKSLKEIGVTETQARGFLREMYNHTQERFAANGMKEVTLFRGSSSFSRFNIGENVRLSGNPLQSFSAHFMVAEGFGSPGAMKVPVSSIIGSARTGFGCLTEGEFVVLVGANSGHVVTMVE